MKILIIDRTPSNNRLGVMEFTKNIQQRGMNFEQIDADSADAAHKAEVYSIMAFPAIAVVRDDGQLVALWQQTLPTFEELSIKYSS